MKTKNEKQRSGNKKRFLTGSVVLMALALVLIGVFYTSCNKEEPLVTDRLFNSKNFVEEPVFPSNPANYMDSVGIYHNEILSQARTMQRSGSRQDILTLVDNSFQTKFQSRAQGISSVSRAEMQRIMADTAALFHHVIDELNLSAESKTFLNSLFSELNSIPSSEYKRLKSTIVEYENRLLTQRGASDRTDASLSSNSREVDNLLSVTSTLRYSLYYWDQESSVGFVQTPNVDRVPPGVIIALADAVGALVGSQGGWLGSILYAVYYSAEAARALSR